MHDLLTTLEEKILPVVRAAAIAVDKNAEFPQQSIDALRAAGLFGLISAKDCGGAGLGSDVAAQVIERIATECGSTAMVMAMHYSAAAVIEKFGSAELRKKTATTDLATLAFSEMGSRSHFWAPLGTAVASGAEIKLDGHKSWVTSANHAVNYVWSAKPIKAEGASSIFLVPRRSAGLQSGDAFDGLGLRGNDSTSVSATAVTVPATNLLHSDGAGLAVMLETVLPLFNLLNAACSTGIMQGAVAATITHVTKTKHEHLGTALFDLPTIRAFIAQMQIETDKIKLLVADTATAMLAERADTMLRVLQCKAAAGAASVQVTELAMRVCGGAAFRKEAGIERRFRDARAAIVMAPTTDQLYDFIGKALCGMPVF
ncbi:MAG: acyl-CoA/acyl-ACP dehydrogenase [Spirochaetes bacterium]|nr:acyl-CoA/acyl-ACP dehydrogenase [Spirochaetota bacterium]